MSHSLTIPIKCVSSFFDFLHAVDAVSEYVTSEQTSILQTANVINRLALFGFSTQEIKKLISDPSNNQAFASLKTSELAYRYMTLVVQLFKGPKDPNETELQFLERAIIAPLADIVKVSSEEICL